MKYNNKMNEMIIGIGESTLKLMQQTSYTTPEKYRFNDERDSEFRREHYQFKREMTKLQIAINMMKNEDELHEEESIAIIMNASSLMNRYMKTLDKLFL